ncbi:hypothetical protein GG344DRAFT_68877 [Lentinula edodes]|nr:hypothetical protein GG344DRAFT_68877 [Lentinula edodes]
MLQRNNSSSRSGEIFQTTRVLDVESSPCFYHQRLLHRLTPRLSRERPLGNIFNLYVLLSVLLQFALHISTLIYITSLAHTFSPPDPATPIDLDAKFTPSLLNTAIYLLGLSQQGVPFREGIRENSALFYGLLGASAVPFSGSTDFLPEMNRWLQIVEMEGMFKMKLTLSMILDLGGVLGDGVPENRDMIRALSVEETTNTKVRVRHSDGEVKTTEEGKSERWGEAGGVEEGGEGCGGEYGGVGVENPREAVLPYRSRSTRAEYDPVLVHTRVTPLVEMKEVVNPEWSYTPDDPSIPKRITVDLRYTLLTDLFLILIADSVYDSRSRSLLFRVGSHLSLS